MADMDIGKGDVNDGGKGDVNVDAGDINVDKGDVTVGKEDVTVGKGDVTVGKGDVNDGDKGDVNVDKGEVETSDTLTEAIKQPVNQDSSVIKLQDTNDIVGELAHDISGPDNDTREINTLTGEAQSNTSAVDDTTTGATNIETATVVKAQDSEEKDTPGTIDPYSYTKRDEYTSEIYKIEIGNLPKIYNWGQLKKKLTSLGLNPAKVVLPPKSNWAFATFRNEADKVKAIELLDGHEWKRSTLTAKPCKPKKDPLLKRQLDKQEAKDGDDSKKAKKKKVPTATLR